MYLSNKARKGLRIDLILSLLTKNEWRLRDVSLVICALSTQDTFISAKINIIKSALGPLCKSHTFNGSGGHI